MKNLFWDKLLGNLSSTTKYEWDLKEMWENVFRYKEAHKSVELEQYYKLFKVVNSKEFKDRKELLVNRLYRDTEEWQKKTLFESYENDSNIKAYFQTLNSRELKDFLQFRDTPEFELLGDEDAVKKSERLKKFKDFEQSAAYKNYIRFKDSYVIKKYADLKEELARPDFIESDAFWSDEERWLTTKEHKTEKRFNELAQNPDIIFYLKAEKESFVNYLPYKLSLEENFDWNTISGKVWGFGYNYTTPHEITKESFASEKQANSCGKNTYVEDGVLVMETVEDKVVREAWGPDGLSEKEFLYTSDILQSARHFRQERGVFQAKIKCSGSINHAFWLGTDKMDKCVNVFHYDGNRMVLGKPADDGNDEDGILINGLIPSQFYIYTLVWEKNVLIWYINNLEVYRTKNDFLDEPMYLAFNSYITDKQKGETGSMEVDWVRVYAPEESLE